jgi:hypothetical protein
VLDTFSSVLNSTNEIVKIGEELSTDLKTTNKPLKDLDFAKLSGDQKGNIVVAVRKAVPIVEKIKNDILGLEDEILLLDNSPFAKYINKQKIEQVKDIIGFGDMFDLAIVFMNNISTVIGENEPANYLLLLQNNTELRPTGGFIGTYGILKVNQAKGELKFDDVYNLDKTVKETMFITPPWQLTKWNDTKQWFLRDANWSPDFIVSANNAQSLYNTESGENLKFTGTIAFTPDVVADIIGLFGEIKVEDLVFTKDSFVAMLEYEVEMKFKELNIPLDKRKEVIKKIYEQLTVDLKTMPADKYIKLVKIINDNLNQKHILLYFNDHDLEEAVAQKNWSGHIRNAESDYLMVVDANLGSLKTDAVMDKKISYSVEYFKEKIESKDVGAQNLEPAQSAQNVETQNLASLQPTEKQKEEKTKNHLIGKLAIAYTNNGKFTWHSTRYRTFTRVYVPEKSRLIKAEGMMVNDRNKEVGEVYPVDELGKTSFGVFVAIEPGESKTLYFEYELPESIANQYAENKYSLSAQKQSGTKGHKFEVKIGEKTLKTELIEDLYIQ